MPKPSAPPTNPIPSAGQHASRHAGQVAGPGAANLLRPVVVLGGMNMDISALADGPLRAGDSSPGRIAMTPGGVGRNIAENLGRLGAPVHLISVVGDDPHGQHLLSACLQAGVDVRAVRVLRGHNSAAYLSVHDAAGVLMHAVNDMAVLNRLDAPHLQAHAETLASAALWVLDANLPEPALAAVLGQGLSPSAFGQGLTHPVFGQGLKPPVLADAVSAAKCQRLRPHLARLQLLKVNRLEAATLLGWPVERLSSVAQAQAAAQALQGQGVKQVVLSLGAAGVVWADEGPMPGSAGAAPPHVAAASACGFCPAPAVTIQSTTGAGDALMAGVAYGVLQGWPLAQAVPWGMACAALTLQCVGANDPALSLTAVHRAQAMMAGATKP